MIARKALLANAALAVLLSYPQLVWADEFTGADVLNWTEAQQDSYFQTSVTMIGIVATQVEGREHIATCIDGWYWKGEGADPEKNASIRAAMQRFPGTFPQAVVLAVVEKACGDF